MKQVQPFKGFAPIDLGGEFIHGSDSIINKTAKENGWVVQPVSLRFNYQYYLLVVNKRYFQTLLSALNSSTAHEIGVKGHPPF